MCYSSHYITEKTINDIQPYDSAIGFWIWTKTYGYLIAKLNVGVSVFFIDKTFEPIKRFCSVLNFKNFTDYYC